MTTGTGAGAGGSRDALAQRLLDGVTVGLALLDSAGHVLLANPAAEGLLGYAQGALTGRALADIYPPDEHAAAARVLEAARAKRVEEEGWRVRGDGSPVRACCVVTALPAGSGSAAFAFEIRPATAHPEAETELRSRLAHEEEARERAEEASRARDEFLATLSHELRTPLTAIMGWAHLLRTGSLDEASRERALETIERNAHLEAQLTADILDVARIITGKLRLRLQGLEAAEIVEAAVETVRQNAEAKRIQLRTAIEGGRGGIAADPDRLQQVVANLLTNAIKFTPEGGEVRVRVDAREDYVTIEVADTGEGIPPDVLPHIFERFRQGGAKARGKGGLGLGLAIVHHIVELHSGHVVAASEGPGRGSTFTVRLPSIAERPLPAVAATHERLDPPLLHDVTVLVVDDQEDARELMCAVLGRCGAHVVAVDSTAAALEAMDRCHPDVVLSDLEMPGEDGYSLIKKIRARPADQGGTVPAAALTAYARTEDRLHSLRAGFHRHVPKPVQPDELAEIVAALAGRRR
jgi:PAS domain S-box-containing protein